MKLTFDTYRFVKLTRDIQYELGSSDPSEYRKKFKRTVPKTDGLINHFSNKYKVNLLQSEDIASNAINADYLNVENSDEGVSVLAITHEGNRLLDTIPFLPFIPSGLLNAWWKHDSLTIKALLIIALGVSGYIGSAALTTIVKSIIEAI